MVSKVKVDTPLCSHHTMVVAEKVDENTIAIAIESDCKSVMAYAERLRNVTLDDINEIKGSKIYTEAEDGVLTPTCLVPIAVYNACWAEMGMISKRLAVKEGPLCLRFIDR